MAYTPTCQGMINAIAAMLNQPANSYIFASAAGTGQGQLALTPQQGAMQVINQALNECARLTIPIWDTATVTVLEGSNILGPYNQVQSTAGRTLSVPISVTTPDGYQPAQAMIGYVLNGQGRCLDPASGSPTAWADQGSAMYLSMPLASAITFSVTGYFLPINFDWNVAPADQDLDMWIDEECRRLVEYWAAAEIVKRRIDVPDLQQRAQLWPQAMYQLRTQIYERLVANDSTAAALFPPLPTLPSPPIVPRPQAANI